MKEELFTFKIDFRLFRVWLDLFLGCEVRQKMLVDRVWCSEDDSLMATRRRDTNRTKVQTRSQNQGITFKGTPSSTLAPAQYQLIMPCLVRTQNTLSR